MAELYTPSLLPEEYDPLYVQREFQRIADSLALLEPPTIRFVPQTEEPAKPREGDIAFADGTNWNPGSAGAGLREYRGGTWNKL